MFRRRFARWSRRRFFPTTQGRAYYSIVLSSPGLDEVIFVSREYSRYDDCQGIGMGRKFLLQSGSGCWNPIFDSRICVRGQFGFNVFDEF